jgi:two-component system, response regulator RegA
MIDLAARVAQLPDRRLLLADDDASTRARLGRALQGWGFEAVMHDDVAKAVASVEARAPAFAVVDLRLKDGSGLDVVKAVRRARADARIIILTAFGSIATAVAAVKAGASDYLTKPMDPDDVARILLADEDGPLTPPDFPMSADRVRWEHIQRVFELCGRNVSETARRLGMHRRTLQRILTKRAPR